ncbi:MAG TPA: type II toxin-antitoxin system RelE/ParE family toxin [Roseiarcus sp.]
MNLHYTLPALRDLDEILDYVVGHSPQGAARVQARIKSFIDLLSLHPFIGTRTDDPTIRRLVITPYSYLVFYEGDGARNRHSRHPAFRARSFIDAWPHDE